MSQQEIESMTQAALERFYDVARKARQEHKLGIINRARVVFGVQQRLLAAGYAPPLVKQVLFAMLVSVFVGKR